MIKVKAPGKLYIAGEYAVIEPGTPAILVAVDKYITVTIKESNNFGTINSAQYEENSVNWTRNGNKIVFDNRDNPFHFLIEAINIAEKYVKENNKSLKFYHLSINSELDNHDGRKLGLGSSAAITVATIKALCKFYNLNVTNDEIFKLSAIAHLNVQGNGSLGDIAASVYGGWIAYSSFNRQWLNEQIGKNKSLKQLLHTTWPQLSIKRLNPPRDLQLLIGWTGSPASTPHLVDKVNTNKNNHKNEYKQFISDSTNCINELIRAFEQQDLTNIQKQINNNRLLLNKLSKISNINIETSKLTQLCNIANKYNGASKTSGAGGGDCGIVIINKNQKLNDLIQEWKQSDIKMLKMNVANFEN